METDTTALKNMLVALCVPKCYTKPNHNLRKDLPHTVYECIDRCSEKAMTSYNKFLLDQRKPGPHSLK